MDSCGGQSDAGPQRRKGGWPSARRANDPPPTRFGRDVQSRVRDRKPRQVGTGRRCSSGGNEGWRCKRWRSCHRKQWQWRRWRRWEDPDKFQDVKEHEAGKCTGRTEARKKPATWPQSSSQSSSSLSPFLGVLLWLKVPDVATLRACFSCCFCWYAPEFSRRTRTHTRARPHAHASLRGAKRQVKKSKSHAKVMLTNAKAYLARAHLHLPWTEIRFFRKIAMQQFFLRNSGSSTSASASGAVPVGSSGGQSKKSGRDKGASRDLQKQIHSLSLSPPSSFSLLISVGTMQFNILKPAAARTATGAVLHGSTTPAGGAEIYATAMLVGVAIAYRGTATDQRFSLRIGQLDVHGHKRASAASNHGSHDHRYRNNSRAIHRTGGSSSQRVIFTSEPGVMEGLMQHPAFSSRRWQQRGTTDGGGAAAARGAHGGGDATGTAAEGFFSFAVQSPIPSLSMRDSPVQRVTLKVSLAPYVW